MSSGKKEKRTRGNKKQKKMNKEYRVENCLLCIQDSLAVT